MAAPAVGATARIAAAAAATLESLPVAAASFVVRVWSHDDDLPFDALLDADDQDAAVGRFADLTALVDATRDADETLRVRWLQSHGIAGAPLEPRRIRKLQLITDGLLVAEVAYRAA